MSSPGAGDNDLLVRSRSGLLDALEALRDHRDSVIVIGAQAIYIRTAAAPVALAEATKDSDLALDPNLLGDDPLIEEAMAAAGFSQNLDQGQPGSWISPHGIPIDLMVPQRGTDGGLRNPRGARLPPHDRRAMRRARGLEAAVVDNDVMPVASLKPEDDRIYDIRVAGAAALLVAKLHKISERATGSTHRLVDKDAHDCYRILVDTQTGFLAAKFRELLKTEMSADVAREALVQARELFAEGPDALGSMMAGRAEEGIGEPTTVSLQTSILARDLVDAVA